MARKFTEKKLVIASHNPGKVREIMELLEPFGVEVINGGDFNLEEPVEDGTTYIENAEIKSRYFAENTKLPSLSDDSGMSVKALDGAPGIYSARWAGPEKDFERAMSRVEKALIDLDGQPRGKEASFICALSLCWPDGHVENFQGSVHGSLTFPPRGTDGFGYDPIFVPNGYDITFGEMDPKQKHGISHRADAFNKLIRACFSDAEE